MCVPREKIDDVEEVTLDSEANWTPVRRPPSTKGDDEGECEG